MVNVVIFDLDDTLYDEIDYCRSGFKAVASCMAQANPSFRDDEIFSILWSEFQNGNRTQTFNKTLEKLGVTSDPYFIKSLVEVYRQHKPELHMPESSLKVLVKLSKDHKLALLSDGYLPAQELKVEVLGISHFFQKIVYTEELGREFWKPSPRGYEEICAELDYESANCVYVADNPKKDFVSPNKLGFAASIQIVRPNHLHNFKSAYKIGRPTHIIKTLGELPALLKTI